MSALSGYDVMARKWGPPNWSIFAGDEPVGNELFAAKSEKRRLDGPQWRAMTVNGSHLES